MLLLGIISSLILLLFIYIMVSQPPLGNMPPGPKGLPLIGNLLDLLKYEHIYYLKRLSKSYGPLFSVQFGLQRVLVISSPKMVTQAFVKQGDAFSGRPDGVALSLISGGKGIVMSSDPVTSHARKCLIHTFKDYGFGKNDVETYVNIELEEFMEALKKNANRSYNPHHDIATSVLNVTWQMISGERFKTGDPYLEWLIHSITKSFDLVKQGGFVSFISFFQFPVIFLRPKAFQVGWSVSRRFKLFRKSIRKHRKTQDDMERRQDFVYHFLHEQNKYKNNQDLAQFYSDTQLTWIMSDLFIASLETTTTVLRWSLLTLAAKPDIQNDLHKEIDAVLEANSSPALTDRKSMPRLEAFIHEVLRMYPPIPLLIHATSKDTTLEGFSIPKKTWVLVNIWGIQMDEKVFGDPQNFRPSRFLDAEGNFIRSENVIPFFLGRRNCIGEPLAMAELFLFLSTILKNYSIHAPDDENLLKALQITVNLAMAPQPFKLKFVPRN